MQGGRRVYSLTAEGRKELAKDPDAVRQIWERAEECEDWGQSFGSRVVRGLRADRDVGQGQHSRGRGTGQPDGCSEILDRARQELDKL